MGEWVHGSDDANNMDFDLVYYFEADETYYFEACNGYSENAFKVSLERVVHTTDDGSIHTDIEYVEGTYSNCTEHGYSGGLYCNECEEFISGHEELPLDEGYHTDDDFDDICDLCGAEIIWEEECEHMCHSDNWFMKIIWTITRFFNKLFGTNQYCECGEAHY